MRPVARIAAVAAGVALVAAVAYVVAGATAGSPPPTPAAAEAPKPQGDPGPIGEQLRPLPAGRRLVVRAVDPERPRRDGQVFELTPAGEARPVGGSMKCKRVAVSPAGRGICLARTASGIGYEGIVFDKEYRRLRVFHVSGVPDRARISPDGRYGAFTTFDRVGSYGYFASTTGFSTQVDIVDLRTGRRTLQEQDLALTRDGRRFAPRDVEYWGVTFAGDDRFYATMATGSDHYMIEGSVTSGKAEVIAEGIECPAISPDGTRIAYKSRLGDSNRWRLTVRDLRTGRDTPLAERRSIDDQPEWLDDETVVYSDDVDVLVVPADGSGRPSAVAERATSPTLVD